MNNQEQAVASLREEVTTMMNMVLAQLERAQNALAVLDMDLATEIRSIEKRVNATELKIDKECENILALYNPVAMDLRFILATLSINTQLERIADHADGIAAYIMAEEISSPFGEDILAEIQYIVMFETAISMVDDAIESFINEDTDKARTVFGKDRTLNKINRDISNIIEGFIKKEPGKVTKFLYLFSIMKKLERVGDLAKNIAEETIFFVDAKYVKHKKRKKKMEKK